MPMNNASRWVLFLIVIAGAGAAYVFFVQRQSPQEQQEVVMEQPPPPAPAQNDESEVETLTRHPIPEPDSSMDQPAKPLPTLADSDFAVQESLGEFVDTKRLDDFLIFQNFITRLVVTIDNLPKNKLPVQRLPNKAPQGKFLVKKQADGTTVIDPENYRRYVKYVDFFEGMDSDNIARIYFRYYPLFQQAYEDLGYKNAYFNDRVITAIDDLLAAPDISGPVKLVQPSVFYKYADPGLEGLSAGQRLMIRIGTDNAARVKMKLRELRDALTKRVAPR